ncbi:MAG: cardiolipin synthase, partial [Myxococcales bacterium]|nr:cardiolipin synthase [Myxococcales bacterium]
RDARHHIHVQFYIIKGDKWGAALRDRLAARAKEGIEVRVLVDAVGSYGLSRGFWDPLTEVGGQVGIFKPVNPLVRLRRRDRVDFRNHRKIVVVDGRLGFTGGINIGKEYLGLNPELGHWRDTHVRIEGPAALALQRVFAEDWWLTTEEALDNAAYYPDPPTDPPGHCAVQVLESGPDQRWSPIHMFYIQAITLARRRIWITSPYFVPDDVLETALTGAALRGVDVRILVPSKSDVRLITWASRSYYQGMLDAGIRIYEYARGFVHAKTMVVDDWVAAVGSANLDIRSFHLNFEVNAFVFSRYLATQLAEQFRSDLRDAREVATNYRDALGIGPRLVQSFARLLSPLL